MPSPSCLLQQFPNLVGCTRGGEIYHPTQYPYAFLAQLCAEELTELLDAVHNGPCVLALA